MTVWLVIHNSMPESVHRTKELAETAREALRDRLANRHPPRMPPVNLYCKEWAVEGARDERLEALRDVLGAARMKEKRYGHLGPEGLASLIRELEQMMTAPAVSA